MSLILALHHGVPRKASDNENEILYFSDSLLMAISIRHSTIKERRATINILTATGRQSISVTGKNAEGVEIYTKENQDILKAIVKKFYRMVEKDEIPDKLFLFPNEFPPPWNKILKEL